MNSIASIRQGAVRCGFKVRFFLLFIVQPPNFFVFSTIHCVAPEDHFSVLLPLRKLQSREPPLR
jgi:hypothetical protein